MCFLLIASNKIVWLLHQKNGETAVPAREQVRERSGIRQEPFFDRNMNSGVGKNYPFCDFETTSARDVSYLDSGEEEWRPPVGAAVSTQFVDEHLRRKFKIQRIALS